MASIPGKLSLSIGLNTKPLGKDLVIAQNQLKGFDGSLRNMAGQFNASFTKARKPIQGTTMAVTNFNRIVQDAPFGLMGISNNIEPMIQSFNKLKASTGSTTGAIKTLVASMFTGPGALITVTSLATTGLLVFGDKLFGAGEKAKEASTLVETYTSKIKDLIKEQNKLRFGDADSLQDEYKAAQNEVKKLEAQLTQVTKTFEEKYAKESAGVFGSIWEKAVFKIGDIVGLAGSKTLKSMEDVVDGIEKDLIQAQGKVLGLEMLLNDEGAKRLETENQILKNKQLQQKLLDKIASRETLQTSFSSIGRGRVDAVSDLNNNPIDIILDKIPVAQEKMQEFTQLQIAQAQALAQGFDRVFDSFARTFVDGLTDLKNFGDAWKAFGKSVVSALKEIAAQLMKMALIRGIGKLLFPTAGTLLTGFDLASQIIGGGGANKSRGAGKMAINSNLFIDGQQLQTQQKFTSYRSNQLGFG